MEALNAVDQGAAEFTKACANAGIKRVQSVFWNVDIYRSITPDILHQLYQGLLKHLIGRCFLILIDDLYLAVSARNSAPIQQLYQFLMQNIRCIWCVFFLFLTAINAICC
jgi:hypothetical protein